MSQYSVELTAEVEAFVKSQLDAGRYSSLSDVVNDALEQARVRAAREKLAALIREGLESSGEAVEYTDEWWDQRMDEVRAEVERRKSA